MPYSLQKSPGRNLFWVVGENGKRHSILPIPRQRAEAQRRALYAAENGYILNKSRSRSKSSSRPRTRRSSPMRTYSKTRSYSRLRSKSPSR